jgi:hypothetical protein
MLVIKRLFYIFVASTTMYGELSSASSLTDHVYAPVPEKAKSYIDSLPERAITVKTLVGRAMLTTSSYRSIQSARISEEASLLEAKSPLAAQLEVEGNYTDDRSEATSTFSTTSSRSNSYRVALSKAFRSGTALEAEISQGDSAINFANFPTSKFNESVASLKISQDLWKNAFGSDLRRNVEVGRLTSESAKLQVNELSLALIVIVDHGLKILE